MTSTKSKIDHVIEQAGAFGKYQWLQLLCLCMGSFLAAFHFLIIVFHSITPKHRLVAESVYYRAKLKKILTSVICFYFK